MKGQPCQACSAPGYKDWEGGDPECAFLTGVFSDRNWNCGTMNALRQRAEEEGSF